MKAACVYVAVALLFGGSAVIPLSRAFDNDPIGDTITRARVNVCLNTFTLCTNQCSARATAARGSYSVCMEGCTVQYQHCMSGIPRMAPGAKVPASRSPPPIGQPSSTPRKVSPQRVTNVGRSNATTTPSPTPPPERASRIDSRHSDPSPTDTPRKAQKKNP